MSAASSEYRDDDRLKIVGGIEREHRRLGPDRARVVVRDGDHAGPPIVGGGEEAREAALALYGDVIWRGPAQVSLHRATSMIASGDVREGAQHATATLAPLSDTQRSDRFVRKLAVRTLSTVPEKARSERAVAELRELLAAASRRRCATCSSTPARRNAPSS